MVHELHQLHQQRLPLLMHQRPIGCFHPPLPRAG
jgi:hypothetical protein